MLKRNGANGKCGAHRDGGGHADGIGGDALGCCCRDDRPAVQFEFARGHHPRRDGYYERHSRKQPHARHTPIVKRRATLCFLQYGQGAHHGWRTPPPAHHDWL